MYKSVFQTCRDSFQTRNMTRNCTEFCEVFTLSQMENLNVQYEDRVYQQVVWIPTSTNCAPLKADLFFYCYAKDVM